MRRNRFTPVAALGLALALAACGGGDKKAAEKPDPAVGGGDEGGDGGGEEETPPPAPAGPATAECKTSYGSYITAWNDWFTNELEDKETQEAVMEQFAMELPTQSALDEMRAVAEELRYEPGFDLWLRALTATEGAIESCGEGRTRPEGV
ncbi:MAG TPA: hypothetical protein VMZ28_22745 [Kofleriaceae bacterium]|nr:hypothetical protein [Kofleriaceae bacterium]